MVDALGPDEVAALIEQHQRVGEALRDMMSGLAAGGGVDQSIFAAGSTISRGYADQTPPAPAGHADTDDGEVDDGGAGDAGEERDPAPPPVVPTFRRDHFVVHPSLDGFTLEEVLIRESPATGARAGVCLVATVEDGKITHIEEYADAAQMRAVTGR
ncbi:MAG: hypothetical protein ABW073_00880 [Acidimicrobiia bacterium]